MDVKVLWARSVLASAPAVFVRRLGQGITHLHALFLLDDRRWLSFVDKFGRLWLGSEPAEILGRLGPEPLAAARFKMLAGQRRRIKPLLLDQRFLAGLGNIYSDKALWRAHTHLLRSANTLTVAEARRSYGAIQAVLRAAIAGSGTTLADEAYRRADGRAGEFTAQLAIYGRAGEPCPRCGATVERIPVGQRGAHFCPRCQPEIPEGAH